MPAPWRTSRASWLRPAATLERRSGSASSSRSRPSIPSTNASTSSGSSEVARYSAAAGAGRGRVVGEVARVDPAVASLAATEALTSAKHAKRRADCADRWIRGEEARVLVRTIIQGHCSNPSGPGCLRLLGRSLGSTSGRPPKFRRPRRRAWRRLGPTLNRGVNTEGRHSISGLTAEDGPIVLSRWRLNEEAASDGQRVTGGRHDPFAGEIPSSTSGAERSHSHDS